MSDWHCYPSRDELDEALALHVAGRLQQEIAASGSASLAVSGGGTPRTMFQRLSRCDLDWSRVWITLVDERWVGTGNRDSNERMVRENLLKNRAAAAGFVGLKTEHADPQAGLAEATRRLTSVPRPFTLVLLGMGADGHTASWFPQAHNLGELLAPDSGAVLGATDPVTAPHPRITLTLSSVLASHAIIIHITGEEKRSVLADAASGGAPVAALFAQQKTPVTVWWAP